MCNLQYNNADDGEDGCFIDYAYIAEEIKKKGLVTNSASYDGNKIPNSQVRTFETGATRDTSEGKIDFEGFLSPLVLEEFGKYMLKHQVQSDNTIRPSDNWQKGMPKDVYMKSAFRHFHDWWLEHRGYGSREGIKDALMGLLFNVMGYTFELLKEEKEDVEN